MPAEELHLMVDKTAYAALKWVAAAVVMIFFALVGKIIWDWLSNKGKEKDFEHCPWHSDVTLHDQKLFEKTRELNGHIRDIEMEYIKRNEFHGFRDQILTKIDGIHDKILNTKEEISEIKILVANLHPWDGKTERRNRRG